MDESFMSFRQILNQMLSFRSDVVDEYLGIHTYISQCDIDSPIELDVFVDGNGVLRIGTTPPLYYVDTTFKPSFHRLRFTARLSEDIDDN